VEVNNMRRSRRQAGEGQAGCLVGLIILLVAIFIAYKVIPVKVRMADLRQTVVDEAKSAGTHDNTRIMKQILAKAEETNLPVTEENVNIDRNANLIRVDVDYTVPIVFPGYTWQWHQHHHAENPIF
jgi:hypothetical protein